MRPARVIVVGGGPAGLAAAEVIAAAGHTVELFDAMPSVGRKFLLAGIGGLNLTHDEPKPDFVSRYGKRRDVFSALLEGFDARALRNWARDLGTDTFVGSSGRVFPSAMKAAPLLRAWLRRLREHGVRLHVRHRWADWQADARGGPPTLYFETPDGMVSASADAVVLALGGASWPRLGSDGHWHERLAAQGVSLAPFAPANCGFDVENGWTPHFRERFAGQPLKPVAMHFTDASGRTQYRRGECVVTQHGLEGSLVYALSAPLRDAIETQCELYVHLDLAPDRTLDRLAGELARPRGKRSLTRHLQSRAGLRGVKAGLLHEVLPPEQRTDAGLLARTIKALPLHLARARPLAEAISSAGGVRFESLDSHLMLKPLPGVFCCGEMLDWEAPTGGYLLTGCFATGRHAGKGVLDWLEHSRRPG